ncbi:MAG: RNA polymerase sigma factor SigZ [Thermodesulfobacteriota bacterium]
MNYKTEEIWNSFNQKLYSFILRRVGSRVEAEDILQEVFLKIHTNIDGLNSVEKLPAWVYRITRNTIIDYYRKKGRVNDVEFNDYMEPQEFPGKGNGYGEIKGCLTSFVNLLPEKYRESVELSEIRGVKQKEVAERLNISLPAAKSRILRGKEMIKQHFIVCCKFKLDKKGKLIGGDWPNENCNECDTCSDE